MTSSFLSQIPWKDNKFLARLLILIFLTIYVFTTVITITPGHFLAILLILALLMNYDKNEVFSNEQILIKLENLTTPEFTPMYMYLDSDLIILFDNIKLDFYKYNPRAFTSSLKACDNLLLLRNQSELQLLPQPKVKNILINFTEGEEEAEKDPKKVGLSNALQTFEAAEIQYNICINYLHSLIISIPSNRTLHQKHSIVMEKADILLKRNLDIIYHIYDDSRELGQLELTRYHTQQPINTVVEDALTSSFNFIL
jgi:hypothetical protein